jgi:hypothetical protein
MIYPGTGELLEEIPTSAGQVVGSAIFIDGNQAIFAGRQGDLVCIDLAKRKEVWNVRVPQENALIVYNPVGEHGNIFLYSRNTIFGYTIHDGAPLFTPIEGAEIIIDGDDWGKSPIETKLSVGKHFLRTGKEGYQPLRRFFSVDQEGPLTFTIDTRHRRENSLDAALYYRSIPDSIDLAVLGTSKLRVDGPSLGLCLGYEHAINPSLSMVMRFVPSFSGKFDEEESQIFEFPLYIGPRYTFSTLNAGILMGLPGYRVELGGEGNVFYPFEIWLYAGYGSRL